MLRCTTIDKIAPVSIGDRPSKVRPANPKVLDIRTLIRVARSQWDNLCRWSSVVFPNEPESADEKIARLELELEAASARAAEAEEQLALVHSAVRAYKQKQEQVARARKARAARVEAEAQARIEPPPQTAENTNAQTLGQVLSSPTGSALEEAWEDPDPTLDDRLTKYLESSFEPDRSRTWMLEE